MPMERPSQPDNAERESYDLAQLSQHDRQLADDVPESAWSPLTSASNRASPYHSLSPQSPPPPPHMSSPRNGAGHQRQPMSLGAGLGIHEAGFSTVPGIGPDAGFSHGHRRAISYESLKSNQSYAENTPPQPTPPIHQSRDYLLGSPGPGYSGNLLQHEPDRSPYGQPLPPGNGPSRWRWINSSWSMYWLLFLGIVFAASHHALYSHLHGTPATDQLTMMRYGTTLAYISKSFMVSAVVFAYRQQIWATLKRKSLEVRTIDSMFAAVDDLTALGSLEFAKKAKVAMGLAAAAWLFPLTVILTPATLTVAPLLETNVTRCPSIRTLNFEAEKTKNWRQSNRMNDFPELSVSLWNCTLPDSGGITTPFNDTFFDYWTGSSSQTDMMSTLSAYATKVIPRDNVSIDTCGAGWNCSYTISFVGPGYKCAEVAKGRDDNDDGLKKMNSPFLTNYLIPDGDYSYVAHTSLGEYSSVQITAQPGGVPLQKPPFPKNLGAFRTEPVLWIGHSDLKDPSQPTPRTRSDPAFNTSFIPTIFRCEHYVTNYTVQFNHTLNDQYTTVLNRTYLHPVVDTTFVPGKDANDGTKDNVTATPESNYVYPLDVENYRITGAYHSLGVAMRVHINGSIQYTPYVMGNTEALKTKLVNKSNYLVVGDFRQAIVSFYEDIVLSLFSNPQFLVVSWAADPTQRSSIGNSSSANDPSLFYDCVKTRLINKYVYSARDLWIVYSLAIVSAAIGVAFGAAALAQNNYHVRNTRLSEIVAATRAPCLEELPWKASKWGEVPPEIKKARLGYGIITEDYPVTPKPGGAGGSGGEAGSGSKVYYGFAQEEIIARGRTRSPSTSPPPEPLKEEFMIEGVEHDDKYRMVEDEFLAVAGDFTRHLHAAEYQRLKSLAKSQNAQTIQDISRPVVPGGMTSLVKRRHAAFSRDEKQRTALSKVMKEDSSASEEEDDRKPTLRRTSTSLQGLMDSPRKKVMPLTSFTSTTAATRAAAGFRQAVNSSPTRSRAQRDVNDRKIKRELSEDEDDLDVRTIFPENFPQRPPGKPVVAPSRQQSSINAFQKPTERPAVPRNTVPGNGICTEEQPQTGSENKTAEENDDDFFARLRNRRAEQRRRREPPPRSRIKDSDTQDISLYDIPPFI
ncbi:hypothetical protein QBC46DRAFT_282316 [Diplogelasinospora grovesii]|uniref:Uncharacterized protein n=1 Tax=Diplogelasinospora grovesii TaxID=303347 RepID=A0AAN6NDX5_9PEZI|nr:hypothetical protein QBC46DRAFT_282316 [Diplogelasinospora grovesii]